MMRQPLRSLLALGLGFLSLGANAQDCGTDGARLVADAYAVRPVAALPARDGWTPEFSQAACRVWPAHPNLTLMAVPVLGPETPELFQRDGDLDVLVSENDSGRVVATLRVADALFSDAVFFDGLSLDTARYRLDPDTTAFAVRTQHRGSSKPNPFGETRLRLLVLEDERLRAIASPILVETYGGEWDTRCDGDFGTTRRTIEVVPNAARYADLVVRETGTKEHSWMNDGECMSEKTPSAPESYRLRYDGDSYAVPAALR